jgi:hypothetical protein
VQHHATHRGNDANAELQQSFAQRPHLRTAIAVSAAARRISSIST